MKKIIVIILAMLIVLILLMVLCKYTLFSTMGVMKQTWNINIPYEDKKEQYTSKDIGPTGDGEYYSILKYYNIEKIKMLNREIEWINEKNPEIEEKINKILEKVEVSEEKLPNYEDYKYYVSKGEDYSSRIYMLYVQGDGEVTIYIIEDIY